MAESGRVAVLDIVENNTRENQKKCRPSIVPEINNNHYLLVQTHIEIYDLMHLTNKKLKHLKKQTLSILHLK